MTDRGYALIRFVKQIIKPFSILCIATLHIICIITVHLYLQNVLNQQFWEEL